MAMKCGKLLEVTPSLFGIHYNFPIEIDSDEGISNVWLLLLLLFNCQFTKQGKICTVIWKTNCIPARQLSIIL